MTLAARERLILALDLPSAEEAMALVRELEGLVSFFKVGQQLFTAEGPDFVKRLIGEKKRVFLDLKWIDIPETVAAAVGVASKWGVSLATIDGNNSRETMAEAARAARPSSPQAAGGSGLKLLCVTALTSLDDEVLKEMGWGTTAGRLVEARTRRAIETGLGGVVASGQEAALARRIAGEAGREGFLVVTPGMRLAGASRDSHRRAAGPEDAVREGADYVVVGRPIRSAADPRAEAQRYVEAIERGLSSRTLAT